MSPVKRQVVSRLVRLACAETWQEVLKELGSKKKRKWVKAWVAGRGISEFLINFFRELGLEDPAGSMNVLRMDQVKLEELIALVSPAIKKQDTVMRSSISCKTKQETTLSFLASDDSFRSLGLLFRVRL